jgi:DNA-binding CsgD family transcriptional regulator
MIQGYVYIISSELGFCKIGRTKNVAARMTQLKSMPLKVDLIHTIACEDEVKFEKELHERYKDKKKSGEWFSLTEDDIEDLKLIKEIKTNGENLEILRLLPEQKNNLLEILQRYAEEKEGLSSTTDININHPKLTGEIITRSFRTYGNILDVFAEFCKGRKEQQKDLMALALIEFMERYN